MNRRAQTFTLTFIFRCFELSRRKNKNFVDLRTDAIRGSTGMRGYELDRCHLCSIGTRLRSCLFESMVVSAGEGSGGVVRNALGGPTDSGHEALLVVL